MKADSPFASIAIVGVGLMGGSFGLAHRRAYPTTSIIGIDTNLQSLDEALRLGAITQGSSSLNDAQADLIVLATPPGTIPNILATLAPAIQSNTIVTDLGSVKADIVRIGKELLGAAFIGGHPMAGSERSGIEAARADLFENANWIFCPDAEYTGSPSLAQLTCMVEAFGAQPHIIEAALHDQLVALVSHLPHLLSFAYDLTVRNNPNATLATSIAAGSYRDLTRMAASSPALWCDILFANRDRLLQSLTNYQNHLSILQTALETSDQERLLQVLSGNAVIET